MSFLLGTTCYKYMPKSIQLILHHTTLYNVFTKLAPYC